MCVLYFSQDPLYNTCICRMTLKYEIIYKADDITTTRKLLSKLFLGK